ncbi:hypothetical protein [Exiguobacterium sp. SRB7LM]|uniref:beta family protein n=1 Tax=Exiguobacterium sp. SRB7LM TaxID=2608401 RepID=UPI0018C386E5|nr:hypothetical protein [Exiguobacterium sp. SRB7LM]MBG0916403.1 hypothetical protein [Exiguobacterium sp. SRB7LM]
MYISIMKNRQEELKVLKDMNFFFGDSLIPYIEIIKDEYEINYEIDESTGDFVYEKKPGKTRRNRIKLPKREEDIITLELLQKRLKGKKCFIDFFRFTNEEYGNNVFKGIELSIKLSRDFNYYRSRILEIGNYENMIPVVSIKRNLKISEPDLTNLIKELRIKNSEIAIRIEDHLLEDYSLFLENSMNERDFLMLDIRSQNVDSKFMELDEFQDLDVESSKIIFNSPRSRIYKNGDYENLVFTKKIDNKVAKVYKQYELNGFGDYGGLKDDLPKDPSGGNGMGAALALIYLKEKNQFYSIVNEDTSKGVKGYEYIRDEVINNLSLLDGDNSCIAIKKIKAMQVKYGNWGTWSNLTLTRYIQQQSKK